MPRRLMRNQSFYPSKKRVTTQSQSQTINLLIVRRGIEPLFESRTTYFFW